MKITIDKNDKKKLPTNYPCLAVHSEATWILISEKQGIHLQYPDEGVQLVELSYPAWYFLKPGESITITQD